MVKKPATREPLETGLHDAVVRLNEEDKVLRQCVDELHDTFKWAVRNGRFYVSTDFEHVAKAEVAKRPTPELFEVGDGVEWEVRGKLQFGEIVETNDGKNVAVVQPIPGTEVFEIKQDELRRTTPDPLSYRDTEIRPHEKSPPTEASPTPAPGRLF